MNFDETQKIMSNFEERLQKIEKLLEKYLKPNTRDDIDRLEQRLSIIELHIRNLKMHSFKGNV